MSERKVVHGIGCGPDGCRPVALDMEQYKALIAQADAAKAKRAADMPDEESAVRAMYEAWQRLKELGWRDARYAPRDVPLQLIEPGSTGIHNGHRDKVGFWIEDGDSWPSRPSHYRLAADTNGSET